MALLLLAPVASAAGSLLNSAATRHDTIAGAIGGVALLVLVALLAFVALLVYRIWSIRKDVGVVYVLGPEPRPPHKKGPEGRLKRLLRMTEVRCVACIEAWCC